MNDAALKGAHLACAAIKLASSGRNGADRPQLILRGFTQDRVDAEFGQIGGLDDYLAYVELRPYTDDISEVHHDIHSSSLVMMPSLSEGFGLSAFEAIAAAVPVVLTFESGLAEYLLQAIDSGIIDPSVKDACIASVIGDDPELIIEEWKLKVIAVISNRRESFQRADRLRAALGPILTWRRAALDFTNPYLKHCTRVSLIGA